MTFARLTSAHFQINANLFYLWSRLTWALPDHCNFCYLFLSQTKTSNSRCVPICYSSFKSDFVSLCFDFSSTHFSPYFVHLNFKYFVRILILHSNKYRLDDYKINRLFAMLHWHWQFRTNDSKCKLLIFSNSLWWR